VTDQEIQAEFNDLARLEKEPLELLARLQSKTTEELNRFLPFFFSTGFAGERMHAMRDTVTAVLYRKVADSLIASIDRSAEVGTKLTKVGWWLTIVIGVVGIAVSVALALR
jgi:hypothetical protein